MASNPTPDGAEGFTHPSCGRAIRIAQRGNEVSITLELNDRATAASVAEGLLAQARSGTLEFRAVGDVVRETKGH